MLSKEKGKRRHVHQLGGEGVPILFVLCSLSREIIIKLELVELVEQTILIWHWHLLRFT